MQLLFKQRVFSWFDSYDIYDEAGWVVYTVKGQLSWGHKLHILDAQGRHVGTVQEKVLTFLPKFELYENDRYLGSIRKELTLFRPRYDIDCMGWQVSGDLMEWDYTVSDSAGRLVARVEKELLRLSDTYVLTITDPKNALYVLMLVLAIDAEKCSRN